MGEVISPQAILIVEDDPNSLAVLNDILSVAGYNVHSVIDGEGALRSVRMQPPDLILLDIRMPEMDGFQVCRCLKASEQSREIPVIFVSAVHDVSDKTEGFSLGAVDYITKPFKAPEVLSRVKTHLTIRTTQMRLVESNLQLREAQDKLERVNADLAERTKQLEATNSELKDFAYIVSHDLKAPLRGVNQLSNWILHDYAHALDEKGKEMLGLLAGRVRRMTDLINGVLEYSRIGRVHVEMKSVDLRRIVEEVISTLAPPAHIQVNIDSDLPIILGAPTRITQLFQNLIGNAIQYHDTAQGVVRIRCEDIGKLWKLSVSDNGPGIEEKDYERIFRIFQTGHRRSDDKSTGIGLTVVKKIVEFYGGDVWVESEIGVGSTFFFTLPKG